MDFTSMNDLQRYCETTVKSIADAMIDREAKRSGKSREAIFGQMKERLIKMKEAVDEGTKDASVAPSGISGGDAVNMRKYIENHATLSGTYIADAMMYSMATSENNARMGVIVATPTAGSAGILPGVLFSMHDNDNLSLDDLTMGLFTASAVGFVIANNAFVSGAAGGCQAEVGSATSMAAATITEMKGGSPAQAIHASAMALKSLLGLVCDPVAGLVEVPCVKRNVMGAAIAFSAADLALAGIESRIPADEVIQAMYEIGKDMPHTLKETALGGLAATPTGTALKERLFQCNQQSTSLKWHLS